MNEIYWITRLDGIRGLLFFLIAISIIAFVINLLNDGCEDFEERMYKGDVPHYKTSSIIKKIVIPILILSSIALAFIPNSKEAMIIFGIGATIDYIKSNDKAKELPDKCIYAIDKFVDEYLEEGKDE